MAWSSWRRGYYGRWVEAPTSASGGTSGCLGSRRANSSRPRGRAGSIALRTCWMQMEHGGWTFCTNTSFMLTSAPSLVSGPPHGSLRMFSPGPRRNPVFSQFALHTASLWMSASVHWRAHRAEHWMVVAPSGRPYGGALLPLSYACLHGGWLLIPLPPGRTNFLALWDLMICALLRGLDWEDSFDAMCRCSLAKKLWRVMAMDWPLPDVDNICNTCPEWLFSLLEPFSDTVHGIVLMTMWRTWYIRNELTHGKQAPPI